MSRLFKRGVLTIGLIAIALGILLTYVSKKRLDQEEAAFIAHAVATNPHPGLYDAATGSTLRWKEAHRAGEMGIVFHVYTGGLVLFGAALLFFFAKMNKDYYLVYCADCGQVIGTQDGSRSQCDRCGSNRRTLSDPGAGHTVKVR